MSYTVSILEISLVYYREIAELHKATVRRASEVQERALSAELQSKQMLQKELDKYKVQARQEQEALITQVTTCWQGPDWLKYGLQPLLLNV